MHDDPKYYLYKATHAGHIQPHTPAVSPSRTRFKIPMSRGRCSSTRDERVEYTLPRLYLVILKSILPEIAIVFGFVKNLGVAKMPSQRLKESVDQPRLTLSPLDPPLVTTLELSLVKIPELQENMFQLATEMERAGLVEEIVADGLSLTDVSGICSWRR